ncbi:hypothetical protein [Staphylospora marina]|uniref:hypothetical protein n=1 Tax=Staphylospora marina TaxID=2490858 RepID=UPI000F5BA4EE|nr:hypothetical protein [Staphylospora marina]
MSDKPRNTPGHQAQEASNGEKPFFYFDLDHPAHMELEEWDRLEEVEKPFEALGEWIRRNED